MSRTGKMISTAIAGNIKKPGIPNPSIQPIDPSKLKTLLKAEIKNKAEIKIRPKKSKILISAASYCYLDMKYDSITNLGLTWAGYLPIKKAYEWDPRNLVKNFDSKIETNLRKTLKLKGLILIEIRI